MTTSLPAVWPVPTPATIFSDAAAVYEGTFTGIDARSANSVAATNCRLYAMGTFDLYLMQANLANELMVNTAQLWLPYHANIWQVPQLQPTPAVGLAIFTSASATPIIIAAGTLLSFATGWVYMTTAAMTVPPLGNISVPFVSALAGSAYNLPAGTVLQLVSAIGGLTQQSATLDSNGAADGTDLEQTEAWRARIIAKIGQPGNGGSFNDYITWAVNAGATYVNVVPQAVGAGSVGLFIAGPGPSVASTQLVAAVQNALGNYGVNGGERPVTARVLVQAATLVPVPITLHLNPDTQLTRAAATTAATLFFLQSAQSLYSIDGQQAETQSGDVTLYFSRLETALSSGSGAYSIELYAPVEDLTFLPSQMFVLGPVSFV